MKFFVTNDDGVHAPGLTALRRALAPLGQTITLAPHEHVSGCSHQATTHRGLTLTPTGENCFMLDGSPVDCTRIGLTELAADADWTIAGINEGGNLGIDVYLSGTVAAAREACLMGRQAISISQYHHRDPIDWEKAGRWASAVVQELLRRPLPPRRFWNVNLPHTLVDDLPEQVFCELDLHALPVRYEAKDGKLHYAGNYHERQRTSDHDVDVCFRGQISITEISL